MAYYRGDYYRGDYYRGDFLGIGKAIKKIAAPLVGAVGGFVTGGPVGAITGALGGLRKATGSGGVSVVGPVSQAGVVSTGVSIARKVLPPLLAGKEVIDVVRGFGPMFGGSNGKKRRSMNHLNPRALARATRRVEGFVKKARKAVSPLGYTVVRRGGGGRCAPKRRCK